MIVNQQEQQQNEDRFGNEVKRRRITVEGDHLKVWEVRVISYGLNDEEGEEKEEKREEEATYIVQEPIQVNQEESIPVVQQPQVPAPAPAPTPAPVQFIGRTVVIETTDRRIHRGRIQSLFELNGERAIHIETSDGENLIFRVSQMCDLKVLHEDEDPVNHNPVNEEPRHEEVIVIEDDDAEVHEVTQRMEVVQIASDSDDCSSDATTECLEDDDNDNDNDDDFPDVPFRPARQEPARQHDAVAEEEVAEEEVAEEEVADDEPSNRCAICIDATDAARNFVSLDCGHQFHFACIMGNMANGGNNRNQCPLCRSAVLQAYDVQSLEARIDEMVENAASNNQRLQDELALTQQHRDDLSAEYTRVMTMNMQIVLRHAQERNARDALERRAYICGLNERIATVVSSACNNDVRHNPSAAVHLERQMRELCMCFGMVAYDAQYDQEEYQADDDDHHRQHHHHQYESSDDEME